MCVATATSLSCRIYIYILSGSVFNLFTKVTTGYPITREKVTVSDRRALIGNCVLSLKAGRKLCGYLRIFLNKSLLKLGNSSDFFVFFQVFPSYSQYFPVFPGISREKLGKRFKRFFPANHDC